MSNFNPHVEMKTILVPTDFSRAARNAAEYAIHLASELRAGVVLFHAYHLHFPAPDIVVKELSLAELQRVNEKLLQHEAMRLKKKTGFDVVCKAKMGFAAEEILHQEKYAMMLVMGMKGEDERKEILMGSTTTSVLKKAKKPVLVIPENARFRDIEKVIYASDYSGINMRTLDTLKCFVKIFGSKIEVLNVEHGNKNKIVRHHHRQIAMESEFADSKPKFYFLEEDDIVAGINKFVRDHHAGMVAIVPHHYNILERMFHKSITRKMAYQAEVPLLALPDPAIDKNGKY